MHSIIGQGKVEQILGSKPEERRALLEEAAGLGKFKARRHRAELKLARVQVQAERARDLEAEVRKRLRPLALQATAAERAEKLKDEIAAVEARLAELELEELGQAAAEIDERRTAASMARKAANAKLEELLVERNQAEEDLADAAGRREEATAALYRLRSAADRLELRREAAVELVERLRAEPLRLPTVDDEQLRTTRERLSAVERALAERREGRAAELARPGRDPRRLRLRPRARRALVRGRDGRGGLARARSAAPGACARGRATAIESRGSPARRRSAARRRRRAA